MGYRACTLTRTYIHTHTYSEHRVTNYIWARSRAHAPPQQSTSGGRCWRVWDLRRTLRCLPCAVPGVRIVTSTSESQERCSLQTREKLQGPDPLQGLSEPKGTGSLSLPHLGVVRAGSWSGP